MYFALDSFVGGGQKNHLLYCFFLKSYTDCYMCSVDKRHLFKSSDKNGEKNTLNLLNLCLVKNEGHSRTETGLAKIHINLMSKYRAGFRTCLA